jgi:CRISPR/Cas system-associated exonuclease Cas4 (RecB family)
MGDQAYDEQETREFTERCTHLHEAVDRANDITDLNAEEDEVIKCARAVCDDVSLKSTETHYELKMSLMDGFECLTYGTADFVAVKDDHCCIVDFKFGYAAVDPAYLNLQLAAYAAMTMQKFKRDRVSTYIIQPRLSRRPSHHSFTDFEGIRDTIKEIIQKCEDPSRLVLIPGAQCKYCPGFNVCPAAAEANPLGNPLVDDEIVLSGPYGLINMIQNDPRGAWEAANLAEQLAAAIKDEMKSQVEAGKSVTGFKLKTRGGKRTITDLQKAFDSLSAYMNLDEFMEHCSVSTTKLQDAYARKVKAKDQITLKTAKGQFNELLEDIIERGNDSTYLERNND